MSKSSYNPFQVAHSLRLGFFVSCYPAKSRYVGRSLVDEAASFQVRSRNWNFKVQWEGDQDTGKALLWLNGTLVTDLPEADDIPLTPLTNQH